MSDASIMPVAPDDVVLPEIPSSWVWATLSQLLESIEAGKSFKCDERPPDENEYGLVKVSAVTWGTYDEDESKTIKSPEQVNLKYLIRAGDFLFSRANTKELVGASVIVHETDRRLLLSDKILRFVFAVDIKQWVNWFLKSGLGRKQIESLSTGNQESMRNIGQERIGRICIPIAPHKEIVRTESKIDELFSRIDEGERALERVQKLVERYRQSVLKAAVTGELTREWREKLAKAGASIETGETLLGHVLTARREAWEQAERDKMKAKGIKPKDDKWKQKYTEPSPPDTSDLPELPEGWAWASVSQVCGEFGNGLSKKPSHTPPGYPILRISAVRPLAVDADDVRYYPIEDIESLDGFLVRPGDLLFTRYNGSKELVGVSGIFHGAEPVLHPDKLIRARVVSEHLICPEYLAITLNCGWSKKHLDQWVKTSAGQHGIAGSDIKRAPFPLPSFSEQLEILEAVEVALSKCTDAKSTCSAQLRRAAAVRQSILKSAFAGSLVKHDSRDEPASALLERIAVERAVAPMRGLKNKKKASK